MSDAADPYTRSIEEIVGDPEFSTRWAYVRPRLSNILIKGQLSFAGESHTPEEVGQFTKFTLKILKLFDQIDSVCSADHQQVEKRKKLHPLK